MSKISLVGCVAMAAMGCFVNASDAPLDREECAAMLDHMHEVLSRGLSGEDLEWFDADRDRNAEIEECLAEQNWSRKGFDCVMKADSQGAFQTCVLRDR